MESQGWVGRAWAMTLIGVVGLCGCGREAPAPLFVVDEAGLLSDEEARSIEAWHLALLRQHDIDYRVLTVAGDAPLNAVAVDRFGFLEVGSASGSGRGLLLVVNGDQGRVRLEVSRELEGTFVDSFVAFIEQQQMAPFFAAGLTGDGIVAATELVAEEANRVLAPSSGDARPSSSVGAGAESKAPIGVGYERPRSQTRQAWSAEPDPIATIQGYIKAMAAHEGSPDLDLYTAGTRAMMGGRVVTRGQMDNAVRSFKRCSQTEVLIHQGHAVVHHVEGQPECAPWFLEKGADGLWRLDLMTMSRSMRFDTRNQWHLAARDQLGPYAFAFD